MHFEVLKISILKECDRNCISADGCTCVFVLVGVFTLVLYVDVELVFWFLFVLLCVHIWEPCKIRDLCNFSRKQSIRLFFSNTLHFLHVSP